MHEDRNNVPPRIGVGSFVQFLPRNYSQDADVHHKVDDRDKEDRIQNRSWNRSSGISDLCADKTHSVVTPIVVYRDQHCRAEAAKKVERQRKRSLRKIKRASAVEMRHTGNNDPGDSQHHANPEVFGDPADDRDVAIQKKHGNHAGSHRNKCGGSHSKTRTDQMKIPLPVRCGQRRKKKRGILGKTNATGSDGQWRAERQLPDEKERHQLPQPRRIINRFQISVRAAGSWQRRPEFSPHESITDDEQRPEDPAEHGLRTSHRSDDKGNRDERSDTDHCDHVERNRAGKTNPPDQFDRLRMLSLNVFDRHERR